ncbi:DUF5133 domain-containing protein [Streptomyces avidinii]|uniref:DUF5133 domain-containing protein n=1 Tax=Streptomyces avidinii TaxID=1895 RepID=UPI0038681B3F|nr:DUF5133 domain-containing protein [Streptomyces avidinii]
MALVPCDSGCARRILSESASAADVCLQEAAWAAVASLRGDPMPPPPELESAVRAAIDRVLTEARPPGPRLIPNPYVLRQHLARFRDLRRRIFAAPEDPSLRTRYDDAAYTLCVLLGHRSVHHALTAAEQLIATNRLTGSAPAAGPNH